jgi:hypothetical protein
MKIILKNQRLVINRHVNLFISSYFTYKYLTG